MASREHQSLGFAKILAPGTLTAEAVRYPVTDEVHRHLTRMAKVCARPHTRRGKVAAVHTTTFLAPGHSTRLGAAAPRAPHDETAGAAVRTAATEGV